MAGRLPLANSALARFSSSSAQVSLPDFKERVEKSLSGKTQLLKLHTFNGGNHDSRTSTEDTSGNVGLDRRGVSFVLGRIDGQYDVMAGFTSMGRRRAPGVSATDSWSEVSNSAVSSFDFAAYVNRHGNMEVHENGYYVGHFGRVAPGEEIEVTLNSADKVQYRVNNEIRYTSRAKPRFPLYVRLAVQNQKGPEVQQILCRQEPEVVLEEQTVTSDNLGSWELSCDERAELWS